MWNYKFPLLACVFLSLAACGSKDAPSSEDTPEAQSSTPASAATAPAKPKLNCKRAMAKVAAAPSAPVTDILGLYPGQTYADAETILACRDDIVRVQSASGFARINAHGFMHREILRASDGDMCTEEDLYTRRRMNLDAIGKDGICGSRGYEFSGDFRKNVTDIIHVIMTGTQGNEQVQAVWRSRFFAEGGQPTVASIRDLIVSKYGEPMETQTSTNYLTRGEKLIWAYDTRGRPLSRSHPNRQRCLQTSPRFGRHHSWHPDCGITVSVRIAPALQNPLLVEELHATAMDQAGLYQGGEETQAAFDQMRDARQAAEAEKAGAAAIDTEL